jgi:predicted outer membrane repeat protein
VVLRAWNGSNPGGIAATALVHVVTQPIHHVQASSPAPSAPFESWATAAANIQDAVDAASVPGALILVSDGTYNAGGAVVYGSITNRVAVRMPLVLRSVNGPDVTTIEGVQPVGDLAVRCVYLTGGAVLSGFTVTKGGTREFGNTDHERSGAGVWCALPSAVVSNCVIAGNAARFWAGGVYSGNVRDCIIETNSGGYGGSTLEGGGGGAYGAELANCIIRSNSTGGLGGGATLCVLTHCVLEGNGIWGSQGGGAYGSTLFDCTLTGNSATYGGGAISSTLYRCALIGNDADSAGGGAYGGTLYDCRLTGNSSYDGGGVIASTLNRCALSTNGAWFGGGAMNSTLNDCVLIGNTGGYGGGATSCRLNNCTLLGNRASQEGGGARYGTLLNCISYYNSSPLGSNYYSGALTLCYLTNCCTAPMPPSASGGANFTADPLFLDMPAGNLRLQSNSPCINAGNPLFVTTTLDLDGRPRTVGLLPDVGAHENQAGVSGAFIAWLQQQGLPTDGSADESDFDNDLASNRHEWIAGTSPLDPGSVLRMLLPSRGAGGTTVGWWSVPGKWYKLERAGALAPAPAFTVLQADIAGEDGVTTCIDVSATNSGPFFYRVGIQE